jgi:phage terminase Nu1 subunit (DNA packaging protein)
MLTGPRRVRACGHTRGYANVVDAQRADVARARVRAAVVATAEKDKQIMELEGELRVAQKELKAAKDVIEKLKQERDKLKAVRGHVFRRSYVRSRRGGVCELILGALPPLQDGVSRRRSSVAKLSKAAEAAASAIARRK